MRSLVVRSASPFTLEMVVDTGRKRAPSRQITKPSPEHRRGRLLSKSKNVCRQTAPLQDLTARAMWYSFRESPDTLTGCVGLCRWGSPGDAHPRPCRHPGDVLVCGPCALCSRSLRRGLVVGVHTVACGEDQHRGAQVLGKLSPAENQEPAH